MAYIVTTVTSTSITAYVAGLDTSYWENDRICNWNIGGISLTSSLPGRVSSGGSVTLNNLQPNTSYNISLIITFDRLAPVTVPGTSATTSSGGSVDPPTPPKPTVNLWTWYGSNGSASASQTQQAYTAISNKQVTTNFSYLVWNDMVDKVNEILVAKKYGWSSAYASINATKMSYYDKTLTATRFNSLRYNLAQLRNFYDVPYASTGDIVRGWYFDTLMYQANLAIAAL